MKIRFLKTGRKEKITVSLAISHSYIFVFPFCGEQGLALKAQDGLELVVFLHPFLQ